MASIEEDIDLSSLPERINSVELIASVAEPATRLQLLGQIIEVQEVEKLRLRGPDYFWGAVAAGTVGGGSELLTGGDWHKQIAGFVIGALGGALAVFMSDRHPEQQLGNYVNQRWSVINAKIWSNVPDGVKRQAHLMSKLALWMRPKS